MPEIKFPSPSGHYSFHIFPWEARMSLWIESFTLVEAATGTKLLSPKDSNWSLDDAQWLDDQRVEMRMRRYPGDHTPSQFSIEFDCHAQVVTLPDGRTIRPDSFDEALAKLCGGSQ